MFEFVLTYLEVGGWLRVATTAGRLMEQVTEHIEQEEYG